jgi:hypothetical protein
MIEPEIEPGTSCLVVINAGHYITRLINQLTERIILAFICFSRIFLLGILIFKGLTARRRYKSFGVKGLICTLQITVVT